MSAYYNEIEPYAAQWLRNLIKEGLIADGEVDTRSIVDVRPSDLAGFDQCHFFAGIGGWSHALRLAVWPDDRTVWTGSCPCQPFSVAGQGGGVDDPRHLWPHFFRLIRAVRPAVVLGEQVAGKAGYGWLDGVRADLEREDYASRGVDLPALAVNAPHIRQRLYWIAQNMEYTNVSYGEGSGLSSGVYPQHNQLNGGSAHSHMADADQGGRGRRARDGDGERDRQAPEWNENHGLFAGCGEDRLDVADAGLFGSTRDEQQTEGSFQFGEGFWDDHIWLTGADGKSRRSKPGLPLLAHGVPGRVGKLRAYGNAIAPPLAAEIIKAFMDVTS